MTAVDVSPTAGASQDTQREIDRLARIEAHLEALLAEGRRRDAELEALRDLAAEVGVLAGPAMQAVTDATTALDERGYLSFARSSADVVDRVVTAFDSDDVAALGDNVVLILQTVKDLTQPEIMQLLRRTAITAQAQVREPAEGPPPSALALLRQLGDPDVRRGLGRLLELLRGIGSGSTT